MTSSYSRTSTNSWILTKASKARQRPKQSPGFTELIELGDQCQHVSHLITYGGVGA